MRQQGGGDLVLGAKQGTGDGPVGDLRQSLFELPPGPGAPPQQFGAMRDQQADALDAIAIIGQSLGHAIDHVLLFGRKLQPRLLQQCAQFGGRLPDPVGSGAGIRHEIARRKAELVMRRSISSAMSPTSCRRCNSAKVESMAADRDDAAMEVAVITARSNRKLPKVSCPIDNE